MKNKEVDNFELIRSKLTFVDQFDRYVCHIMRRTKDNSKLKKCGSNESQRLLRTYYFGDLDYFDAKIPAIKELCGVTGARAYILPQVRNNRDCLINLGKLVFENLDNPTIKLDGITRKAVCSCHKSRDKKWILDFDNDGFIDQYEEVKVDILKNLRDIGRDPDKDLYEVPTRNGRHIVTSPFNLMHIQQKYPFIFEGEKKMKVGIVHTGPGEYEDIMKKVVGLLHKDGATLLYAP